MIVYIGIAGPRRGKGLYDRVWKYHCNGAINNSSLRHSIAKHLGLPILYKETGKGKVSTASTSSYVLEEHREMVDSKINEFLLNSQWRFITIKNKKIRNNFEGWLIDLFNKPLLNNKREKYKIIDQALFSKLFNELHMSPKYNFDQVEKNVPKEPGIYVLYNENVE